MTRAEQISEHLLSAATGLAVLGCGGRVLVEASDLLVKLQRELDAVRASGAYRAGFSDGHNAAFATGLVGDDIRNAEGAE